MTSIALVAGDPSADQHAARVIALLKQRRAGLDVTALGGPAMRQAGASLLMDLTTASSIGPFDAAQHILRFRRAKQLLEEHLRAHRPDLAVLVDFGDFNLPVMAPLIKRHRIPIAYYISPQLWAWGRWRLRYVRRYIDRMIVLFKFEEAFYRQAGIPVTWVGHPLIDQAQPTLPQEEARRRFAVNPWRMTVGLLPGSRKRELRRHLPLFLDAARRIAWHMPGAQFLLPKAPSVSRPPIERAIARACAGSGCDVRIVEGSSMREALQLMDAAIVASGTATLETALAGVPMAVVYRTSWPTYLAVKAVLRIPHIALVNIVAQRKVVPEFVQHRAKPAAIAQAIVRLLRDEGRLQTARDTQRAVAAQLGPPGADARAADALEELLAAREAAGRSSARSR